MKKTAVKLMGITAMVIGVYVTYKINGYAALTSVVSVGGAMLFIAGTKGDSLSDIKEDLQGEVDNLKNK